MITIDRLRSLLAYDPQSGEFTWRSATCRRKEYLVGKRAGAYAPNGYLRMNIDRKNYLGHRLAWFYVNGVWPVGDIDHINGNRSDNRIANLRDVAVSINRQNLGRATSRSKTGRLGVFFNTHGLPFRAAIHIHGRQIHLGNFATVEDASAAYVEAKTLLHAGCARISELKGGA